VLVRGQAVALLNRVQVGEQAIRFPNFSGLKGDIPSSVPVHGLRVTDVEIGTEWRSCFPATSADATDALRAPDAASDDPPPV
jgi:hypothetical protein